MSTLSEVLDRLTGVAFIRERVTETRDAVKEIRTIVLDHERRLLRIEVRIDGTPPSAGQKRLPPGR